MRGEAQKHIQLLKAEGKSFVVQQTSASTIIKLEKVQYNYTENYIARKHLHLFQKVKKEVQRNIDGGKVQFIEKPERPLYQIMSSDHDLEEGEVIQLPNKFIQYDVDQAYYNAALKLGFLTPAFYETFKGIPKHLRLVMLGSLATRKIITEYQVGEMFEREIRQNDTQRAAFFSLVRYVDKCLFELSEIERESFLFYWVDGIFLRQDTHSQKRVQYIANKYELTLSDRGLNTIELSKRAHLIQANVTDLHNGTMKPFLHSKFKKK
jgi:hypothetical protein